MSAAHVLTRPHQLEESEAKAAYEIARLISGNGTFYDLDPNNNRTATRWLSSWDPQRDAGFIRPGLSFICGDFDTEDGLDKAFMLKRRLSFPSAVMHSGGKAGRAHIFIAVSTKAQRLHCEEEIRKAGGPQAVRREGIRPPGALHRSGKSRSTSAEGFTLQQILELLRDAKRPAKQGKKKADLHQLASEPVPIGDRSHRLYFLGQEAKRQGWTFEAFCTLILSHPEGAGEKIAKDHAKRQNSYLRDIWAEATRGGNESPSLGKPDLWTRYVLNDPRVRASRLNLEQVVLVIAELSRLRRGSFHLSNRSLADLTNRGASTAGRCLRALCQFGHLRVVATGGGSLGCVYVLELSGKWSAQPLEGERGCTEGVCHFQEFHSHDSLTGRNGLRRTWLYLSPTEPLAAAEVASRARRGRSSISAQLKKLAELGLAAKVGRGYVRIEDKAAHAGAAQARGSLGRGARRKLIHALQREGWKLERQRRADARIKEAKRLKLKDQLKPDQATQNRTKIEHLPGSKLSTCQPKANQRSKPLRV